MVARAARSLESPRTIGIACETRGTRRSLRVSRRRFQLSTMLEFICGSRAIRSERKRSRFFAIELAPVCVLSRRRFRLPLLSSRFVRSILGRASRRQGKKVYIYYMRLKIFLEMLIVCNSQRGKIISSILNYIQSMYLNYKSFCYFVTPDKIVPYLGPY